MMSHIVRALVAATICALAGLPTVATAQEPVAEVAARGPRFLLASAERPAAPPKVIRPEVVPALRRRIALNLDQVTLEQALTAISQESGLRLVYSRSVLALDAPVRLRAADISVAAALTVVLLNAGIDVLLRPDGQVVLVRRGDGVRRYGGAIAGQVTDTAGRPIRGAEVSLKTTTFKVVTGDSGRYHLPFEGVASGQYTVQVRMLGYRPANRAVEVADTNATIRVDVVLQPVAIALNELITTATGQQRRRDLGNAITTIRADSVLQSAPIRNLTDLLENRVPGMTVQHTTGAPGDPARIRLRGLGSVMRGNDPVVIVDGVRIYSTQSEVRSGNLVNVGGQVTGTNGLLRESNGGQPVNPGNIPAPSPLDQIDPNIIENVEVFKGPSAATLYGPDAANGVIVITTKKGRPGPTRWNASVAHGRTNTPGQWPEGYFRWGHAPLSPSDNQICPLIALDCITDSLVRYQVLNDPNLTMLGQGRLTRFSLTASGGNQALTYSITGTYDDEIGLLQLPPFEAERFRTRFSREPPDWMQRPHGLEKWSVTSNVRAQLGQSADVTLSTTLSRTEQQRSSLEGQISRMAGVYVDKDGNYYSSSTGALGGTIDVPTPDVLRDYYKRTTASQISFTTGLGAGWRPLSWLDASAQVGVNVIPRQDEFFLPPGLFGTANAVVALVDSGVLIRGTGRTLVSTFNFQGRLHKPLGWGFAFETSIGANLTTNSTDDVVSTAAGLVPGTSALTGATRFGVTENRVSTSAFGWYIEPRIAGQRLSLSTGVRLDGGSTHGTQISGVGNFLSLPKLNGSWVISEEPFFPFKAVFSSLRLRAAYGQAQVQPGAADRLRLYTGRPDQNLLLTTVGNSELRPERSVEFEGGFDADLLESRVTVELTAYRKTQVDALMPVQLPMSVNGGGGILQNIGNIRNQGLELTLGLTPVQSPTLTWSAQLSYSRNANTLVKLGRGVLPSKEQGLVEGYPVHGRWARPILGYADQNGNGVIEREEVQVGDSLLFMGRLLPEYTTALHTNLVLFGAIGITAGFSYDAGAIQVNQLPRKNWVLVRGLTDPSASFSEQAAVLISTPPPGASNARTDYGLMQDVSTFRFSSLGVNYRAPARVARLLRAQQLTIGVQGSNLGLHSNYTGKDPNVNSWSAGEDIVDTGQLPMPRTWQLSMFLQY